MAGLGGMTVGPGALAARSLESAMSAHFSLYMFAYRLFCQENANKEFVIRSAPRTVLYEMVKYTQDPKLKREIYDAIRSGEFQDHLNYGRSIFVNEATGIYKFIIGAVKYAKITAKMYFDT